MVLITKLEMAAHKAGRVNLFLDDEFAFSIALPLVADYFLVRGKELSEEQIAALKAADAYQQVFSYALNFITGRPRSEHEVRERLERREYEPAAIEKVITRLKEINLLDDHAFATSWIKTRDLLNPRGKALLRQELRAKGVKPDIINTALADIMVNEAVNEDPDAENEPSGRNEEALCLQAAQKKFPSLSRLEYDVYQRRMLGYLQRRGFPFGISARITRQLWGEKKEAQEDYD